MIRLTIEGQKLKATTPMIVSDTVNYIEVDALFSGEWNGLCNHLKSQLSEKII